MTNPPFPPPTNAPFPAPVVTSVTGPVLVHAPAILPEPAKVGDKNIAPTTTAAEDKTKAGQRLINFIWESMQALIAVSVVGTTLYVSGSIALLATRGDTTEKQFSAAIAAFMLVSNLASLVVGFYFGRTNHVKIGGVRSGDTGR